METRTQKSFRNIIFGLGSQGVELILKFIGRTVFIRFLAVEYLGVNGLFGEILTMLSLAELGIGGAIGVELYKPLREGNTKRIAALMKLYKKAYAVIGVSVGAVGLILIPFLNLIVKDPGPVKDDLIFIYLFYLFNTVITYFYSYKSTVLVSDQKNYIVQTVKEICNIVRTVFQTVMLIVFRNFSPYNFYLYLAVESVCIFANNFVISLIVDKKYKYIKEQKNEEKLEKKDLKKIFKNIKALSLTKISTILVNSTDNTLMSMICGIAQTGLYSNYVMFTNIINTVLAQIFSNLYPSVGNLNAEGNKIKSKNVFDGINLLNFWLYSIAGIGVFVMINDVIRVWAGEEYLLSFAVVAVIAINIYTKGMLGSVWIFKDTYGLFRYGQYMNLITAALNIGLSIWFGKLWGIAGILLATAVSRLVTNVWYDPLMLFKHGFEASVKRYFFEYIGYGVLMIVVGCLTYMTAGLINVTGLFTLLAKLAATAVMPNIIYFLLFFKTKRFGYVKERVLSLFKRKQKAIV